MKGRRWALRRIAYRGSPKAAALLNLIGEEPIAVEAGEVIVFTKGDPACPVERVPACAPIPTHLSAHDAVHRQPTAVLHRTLAASGPTSARFVCGFLACDAQPFNPLLDNLPPIIKTGVPQGGDRRLAWPVHPRGDDGIGRQARRRRKRARQAERADVHRGGAPASGGPAAGAGWAGSPACAIPFVGKALSLMHAKPARNWTIEDLAKDVALSRSVLAERFADLVGMPPMHYLAKWRMQIAFEAAERRHLQYCNRLPPKPATAPEAAFSRAFKKMVGCHRRPGVTASNRTRPPATVHKSPPQAREPRRRTERSPGPKISTGLLPKG